MGRKRTGTVKPHDDHFDARITLNDGSRPWIHLPPGLTEKQARAKAISLTETARKGGGVLAAKAALEEAKGESCAAWLERWLASRKARGLTPVDGQLKK